ncbi:MAG: hypothetical protein QOE61_150, partial [Micromonosporaceae bacterium]|nr:hypothetical protein [Micromonosporaceae bacterium]
MRDHRLRWVLPLVAVMAAVVACWVVRPTDYEVLSAPFDDGKDVAVRYTASAGPTADAPFALGVRRFNFNR